jgi:DUF4097 and DUF4098 domain-containing protein YvlB
LTRNNVSPFVCGVWRPTVVLPRILVDRISSEELLAVLSHEFAHVQRRDILVGWAVTLCEALYFFHPAFQMAKRGLMLERERACDERVLVYGQTKRNVYGRGLIAAAEICRGFASGMSSVPEIAETFGDLKKRVTFICSDRQPRAHLSRSVAVILTLFTLLCLPRVVLTARGAPSTLAQAENKSVEPDRRSVRYDRTVDLLAPMEPGYTLAAEIENGSINVSGANVKQCSGRAVVRVRAAKNRTLAQARELAKEVKVGLQAEGKTITVKVEGLQELHKNGIGIQLNLTVPKQCILKLANKNGGLRIENIEGQIAGETTNGEVVLADIAGQTRIVANNGHIVANRITGETDLEANKGSITGKDISGDIHVEANLGSVEVVYAKEAPKACNVSIEANLGNIAFTGPPDMSAVVDASVTLGMIKTELPLVVEGDSTKTKTASGTLGEGKGKVHLEANLGLITIGKP